MRTTRALMRRGGQCLTGPGKAIGACSPLPDYYSLKPWKRRPILKMGYIESTWPAHHRHHYSCCVDTCCNHKNPFLVKAFLNLVFIPCDVIVSCWPLVCMSTVLGLSRLRIVKRKTKVIFEYQAEGRLELEWGVLHPFAPFR